MAGQKQVWQEDVEYSKMSGVQHLVVWINDRSNTKRHRKL